MPVRWRSSASPGRAQQAMGGDERRWTGARITTTLAL
jgi:hypothetical protein